MDRLANTHISDAVGMTITSLIILVFYSFVLSCIPRYDVSLYKEPSTREQPFSYFVTRNVPLAGTIGVGLVASAFAIYLAISRLDFISAIGFSVIVVVDTPLASMIRMTPATAIQPILFIFSLLCAGNATDTLPHEWSLMWAINLFLSWFCALLSLFFNCDSLAAITTLIIYFGIVTHDSAVTRARTSKKSYFSFILWEILALLSAAVPGVIALFFINATDKFSTPFSLSLPDFAVLIESLSGSDIYLGLAIGFVVTVIVFMGRRRSAWITIVALFAGGLIGIITPVLSEGDTYTRKFFFSKLLILMATALWSGNLGNVWHTRALAVGALALVGVGRLVAIRQSINKPLFQ